MDSSEAKQRADELIVRLNIIINLRPNQKLNTTTLQISNVSSTTSLIRTLGSIFNSSGVSRHELYEWLKETFNRSILFIRENNTGNIINDNFCDVLYKKICAAKVKLSNIKITYQDDSNFVSRIDSLCDGIQIGLDSLKHLNNSVYEHSILNPVPVNTKHQGSV
jgi:hypothetical protein